MNICCSNWTAGNRKYTAKTAKEPHWPQSERKPTVNSAMQVQLSEFSANIVLTTERQVTNVVHVSCKYLQVVRALGKVQVLKLQGQSQCAWPSSPSKRPRTSTSPTTNITVRDLPPTKKFGRTKGNRGFNRVYRPQCESGISADARSTLTFTKWIDCCAAWVCAWAPTLLSCRRVRQTSDGDLCWCFFDARLHHLCGTEHQLLQQRHNILDDSSCFLQRTSNQINQGRTHEFKRVWVVQYGGRQTCGRRPRAGWGNFWIFFA